MPIAENVLARGFEVDTANKAWVGDITYIATATGWLFLAVVLDLFSRRVVGWAMATHMRAELVVDALKMATDNWPEAKMSSSILTARVSMQATNFANY